MFYMNVWSFFFFGRWLLGPHCDFHYSHLKRVHEVHCETAKSGQCRHPGVTAACIIFCICICQIYCSFVHKLFVIFAENFGSQSCFLVAMRLGLVLISCNNDLSSPVTPRSPLSWDYFGNFESLWEGGAGAVSFHDHQPASSWINKEMICQ